VSAARPSGRELRDYQLTWQAASVLLCYPDEQLLRRASLLRTALDHLPGRQATPLRRFHRHVESTSVLTLAADYVSTFDHQRRCCLYLTYYAHRDTRKRGMALLAFKNAYRAAGLELAETEELPDHLAVVLEFAATTDPQVGRQLLLDHRAGIELLRLALESATSPYADVLRAVTSTLPPLAGDERDAIARLAAAGPPVEEVGLQPFGPPEHMPQTEGARR
jgi:nitrate reductase delta subunit